MHRNCVALLVSFAVAICVSCDLIAIPLPSTTASALPTFWSVDPTLTTPAATWPTPTDASSPTAIETPNVEPLTGIFRLSTNPAAATTEWRFHFKAEPGGVSREPEVVPAGRVARIALSVLPGVYRVILNAVECVGSFPVAARVETMVLVDVLEDGTCGVSVTGSNPQR